MNGNDDRSKNDNDNDGWFWLNKDIFKSSDMMNSGSIRQSLRMLRILLTDLSCGRLARHLLGGFGWDLNFGSTERTDGIFSYSNIAAIGWYIYSIYPPNRRYTLPIWFKTIKKQLAQNHIKTHCFHRTCYRGIIGTWLGQPRAWLKDGPNFDEVGDLRKSLDLWKTETIFQTCTSIP